MAEDILPLYKMLSVPLYRYPTLTEMRAARDVLLKAFGSYKAAREYIRDRYSCYLSQAVLWRSMYVQSLTPKPADPPVEPRLVVANVVMRGAAPLSKVNYEAALAELGVTKLNPYRTRSPDKPRPCVGFYSQSMEQIEAVVDELGRRGLIEGAIIVNAVWSAKLGRPMNVRPLVEAGMVLSLSTPKTIKGYIGGVLVTIFPTKGVVRINGAPTPEIAMNTLRMTYGLLLSLGVFKEGG